MWLDGREGEEAHPSQSPPCQTFSFPSWKRCPSHWDLEGCDGVRVCVAVSERQGALSGKWWQAAVQREEKSASVSTPNDEIGEGRLACAKQEWHVFLHCSTLIHPTMVNVAEARTCVPGAGCRRPKRNSLVGNGWAWPGQVGREHPRLSRPRTPTPTNTRAAHTITCIDCKVQQAGWHKARRHGGFPRFA